MSSTKCTIRLLALLACAAAGAGCGGGPACTAHAVVGINVIVKDPAGAAVCDASVEARDGAFSDTLMAWGTAPDCFYSGIFERPATYTVTIARAGFRTETLGVTVSRDDCHVVAEQRTVQLTTQ